MEKAGILYWLIYTLLFIWQLPQAIVGLVLLLFCKNKNVVTKRHYNTCIETSSISGGISLGPFCVVGESFKYFPAYIAHEVDGHTVQSKILGPLYLIVIGLPSFLCSIFVKSPVKYNNVYTEKWANNCAGVITTTNGSLAFKEQNSRNNTLTA